MSEERLIELETKAAHQEVAIEELLQAVHAQYLLIDKLEKNLKLLTERFDGVNSGGQEIGPGDEKPPHY